MKTKAVNMCLGCGKTVNTSEECYFDQRYGLYAHTDCESKLKNILSKKTWVFENRRKEWEQRNDSVSRKMRLEY